MNVRRRRDFKFLVRLKAFKETLAARQAVFITLKVCRVHGRLTNKKLYIFTTVKICSRPQENVNYTDFYVKTEKIIL
jgi:hypothetical protein